MTKHFCDRCHDQIEIEPDNTFILEAITDLDGEAINVKSGNDAELCDACISALDEMIRQFLRPKAVSA